MEKMETIFPDINKFPASIQEKLKEKFEAKQNYKKFCNKLSQERKLGFTFWT